MPSIFASGSAVRDAGHHFVKGDADVVITLHAECDAADFGFVQNIGRGDLQRDRAASGCCCGDRFFGVRCQARPRPSGRPNSASMALASFSPSAPEAGPAVRHRRRRRAARVERDTEIHQSCHGGHCARRIFEAREAIVLVFLADLRRGDERLDEQLAVMALHAPRSARRADAARCAASPRRTSRSRSAHRNCPAQASAS